MFFPGFLASLISWPCALSCVVRSTTILVPFIFFLFVFFVMGDSCMIV